MDGDSKKELTHSAMKCDQAGGELTQRSKAY
jgi:hypothetical protein